MCTGEWGGVVGWGEGQNEGERRERRENISSLAENISHPAQSLRGGGRKLDFTTLRP